MPAFSLLLAACVALVPQDTQRGPMAAAPVDLRCQLPAGKAIEVVLQSNAKGSLSYSLPRDNRTIPLRQARRARFLDEMLELDSAKNTFRQRRLWLEAQKTVNGDAADPPLCGAEVTYTSNGERISATLGGRMLPTRTVDAVVRESDFVGLWLALPAEAIPGTRYALDAAAMIQTLFDNDAATTVDEAWITLDRVDPETAVAYLTGHLEFTEPIDDSNGLTASQRTAAALSAEVHLGERRVTKLVCTGSSTLTGTQRYENMVKGELEFTTTVSSKPVGDPEASRQTIGKCRDNVYRIEDAAIRFALPSYWARLPRTDAKTLAQFIDVRDDAQTRMQIVELSDDSEDLTTDRYIASFTRGMEKTGFTNTKIKKSKCALGKMLSYTADFDGGRCVVGALVSSGPSQKLSIQLIGRPECTRKAERVFDELLQSLKVAAAGPP